MYPGIYAARTPGKAAVIEAETGRTITYAELESRSAKSAHWLREQGLRRTQLMAGAMERELDLTPTGSCRGDRSSARWGTGTRR